MAAQSAHPRSCSCWIKIDALRAELRNERRLRVEAERNANRFHALLIAERVRQLPAKENTE